MRASILPALLALAACGRSPTPGPGPSPDLPPCDEAPNQSLQALQGRYISEIHPLLTREATLGGCVDCHGPNSALPMVVPPSPAQAFTTLWADGYLAYAGGDTLLGAVRGESIMPMPPGGPAWLADEIDALTRFTCALSLSGHEAPDRCGDAPDPGFTPLRRLSRDEYDRTVWDLTGFVGHASASFPPDETSHGFDNLPEAQHLSPLHVERFAEAAEVVAHDTIAWPEPIHHDYRAQEVEVFSHSGVPHAGNGWGGPREHYYRFERMRAYAHTGLVRIEHAGTYTIRARVRGRNADDWRDGVIVAEDLPPLAAAYAGGLPFGEPIAVPGAPGLEWGDWRDITFTAVLDSGTYDFRVGIDNVSYGSRRRFPVALDLDDFTLSGPRYDELPPVDPTRRLAFVPCDDAGATCRRQIVTTTLGQTWRRAPTSTEIDRYQELLSSALADGASLATAAEQVLQAALLSPHFLFRAEVDPNPDDAATRPLTGPELATRLSYFVWGSMPDERLAGLGADGSLRDPAVLQAELDRLLADPRASALVDRFGAQWLGLDRLDLLVPSPTRFPEFDDALRASMAEEVRLQLASLIAEDRSLLDLLDADFLWVDARLAAHYGVEGPEPGQGFARIAAEGTGRGGLLTSAAVLAMTSHPAKTSPTLRGKWVLDQLLCQPPADPPPLVDTSIEPDGGGSSVREVLERHRADPACASCHVAMDSLGLALEAYDPLGRLRELDDFGMAVDTSAVLPDGTPIDGPADLAARLRADRSLTACMVQKMAIYAVGRGPEHLDRCALRDIHGQFAESGHTLRGLVRAIVFSPLFLERRAERPSDADADGSSQ